MNSVAARTKMIFGNDLLMGDLIECAKNARNSLVHRGHFAEHGLTDVVFLKIIVESVLEFLITNIARFPDKEKLDWFYAYGNQEESKLGERIVFLQSLLQWRENAKGS